MVTALDQLEKRGEQRGIQQGIQQGIQRGIQQGMQQAKQSIARDLLAAGADLQFIKQTTHLSDEELSRLI